MIQGIDPGAPGAGVSGSWKEATPRRRRSRGRAALWALALLAPWTASAAVAAWTPAGPDSGTLRVLPAPSSPATIYAAPGDSAIWSSQDGGLTWSIASRLSATVTSLVAVDPVQATTVYAFAGNLASLYKSTDGAATWTFLTDAVSSFVIAPSAPRTMYSPVNDPTFVLPVAVMRSDDGGATWNQVGTIPASFNENTTFLAVSPVDPNRVYVMGQGGFLASSDGGVSWGEEFSPLTTLDTAIGLAVSPIAPRTLWIAIARPVAESGAIVYRSDDGGASWVEADAGLPPIADLVAAPSGTLYASAPLGSGLEVAIFSSADRGASWQQAASGIRGGGGLTPGSGTPDRLFLSAAGIQIGRDQGKSWSSPARPPSGAQVTQVSIGPAAGGHLLYVAETADGISSSGLWESANRGATWRALAPTGDFDPQLALDAQPDVLYAFPGGVSLLPRVVSRDDGATWAPLPPPASPQGQLLPLAFAADPLVPGKLAELDCEDVDTFCVSYPLELSDSGGRAWHRLGLMGLPVGSDPVTLVRFGPGDPASPYAVLGDNLFVRPPGSRRLTVLPTPRPVVDLAVVPGPGAGPAGGPPTLFAACLGWDLVWKSVDGGRHWRASSIGLPQDTVTLPVALAVDPEQPATLYLATRNQATRNQVFVSRNAAGSWQPLATDGLPPGVPLTALAVAPGSPRLLVAGTWGAGIFTLPLP